MLSVQIYCLHRSPIFILLLEYSNSWPKSQGLLPILTCFVPVFPKPVPRFFVIFFIKVFVFCKNYDILCLRKAQPALKGYELRNILFDTFREFGKTIQETSTPAGLAERERSHEKEKVEWLREI